MNDNYFTIITETQHDTSSDGPTIVIILIFIAIVCLFPQFTIRR